MIDRNKKASKSPKVDQRWTLLFIGSRGRTVTFKHFKGVVIAVVLLVGCLGAACGWLLYQNIQNRETIAAREERIDNLKTAIAGVRNEKDILTARLAVIESRVEENLNPDIREKDPPPPPTPEKTTAAEEKQSETLPSVIADDFIVFYDPDIERLRVEYKVRNTGSNNQPASGRSVVILKGDPQNQSKWLVMPSVPLQAGEPVGDSGRSFSIYNYRTLRFQAPEGVRADQFQNATVFIFSTTGTLIHENEFPVSPDSSG
jgi:hypothetical protein